MWDPDNFGPKNRKKLKVDILQTYYIYDRKI